VHEIREIDVVQSMHGSVAHSPQHVGRTSVTLGIDLMMYLFDQYSQQLKKIIFSIRA
jgi:hypothetical protein